MPAADGRARAATRADATDPELRDRLWGVPFEDVWQAATALLAGGLRRWSLERSDDGAGVLEGTAGGWGKARHDVRVEVGLDPDAQTFLRATVTAQEPGADYGRAARRLRRFLRRMDQAVAQLPERRAGRSA